jgi:hypothetical protein
MCSKVMVCSGDTTLPKGLEIIDELAGRCACCSPLGASRQTT